MKRFLQILFGDWGLVISSIITCVLSAVLFPLFMFQIKSTEVISTFLALLIGIFVVGFYGSSTLSAIILSIRSGLNKRWFLFILALLVVIADVVVLIINLV